MISARFGKLVVITDHARRRMTERAISDSLLLDVIETGEQRFKDATRLWIAKDHAERDDNLLCVVAVLEAAIVVKTVMHHFTWDTET